jgi:uncharacterized protein (TIGR00255 family)
MDVISLLRSMTGFGQARCSLFGQQVQIDIRSVNHRYGEIAVRLPRAWTHYEDLLKKTINQSVRRGKVDVTIEVTAGSEASKAARLDWALLDGYRDAVRQIADRYGLPAEVSVQELLSVPGAVAFVEKAEANEPFVGEGLKQCAEQAAARLVEMREAEGRQLQADIGLRIANVEELVSEMMVQAPHVAAEYRSKLMQRLADLPSVREAVDETRLAAEVALFADKCNIDEELARLRSHLLQLNGMLEQDEPVGRKMDFVLQEMNREANTIGSKSNQARLASLVIDMKAELEKLREQAQNIE